MRLRHLVLGLSAITDIVHVAFDLDGTLVDSRADLAAAVNAVRRARGLTPLGVRAVQAMVGEGARALVRRAMPPGDDDELAAALAAFVEHYGAHCLDRTRPYPGVPEALRVLRAGGRSLSVVTNKPAALAERILAGLGLRDAFDVLVGGDTLPTRKPDPAAIRHVAAHAGVGVAAVALIGDSPIDHETAVRAGCAFVGVAWGFEPGRLRATGTRVVVERAAELDATLRGLRRLDSESEGR